VKLVKDKDARMVFGKTKYDENHSINHQVSNQIQFGKCFLLFSIGVRIAKEIFCLNLVGLLSGSIAFHGSCPIISVFHQ
jgi:hypothetical protein